MTCWMIFLCYWYCHYNFSCKFKNWKIHMVLRIIAIFLPDCAQKDTWCWAKALTNTMINVAQLSGEHLHEREVHIYCFDVISVTCILPSTGQCRNWSIFEWGQQLLVWLACHWWEAFWDRNETITRSGSFSQINIRFLTYICNFHGIILGFNVYSPWKL